MQIYLLELYRHPKYLLPPEGKERTLSSTAHIEDIERWWENAGQDFKNSVLKSREKDEDIKSVCMIVKVFTDVMVICHEYNPTDKKFTNPQVISCSDVKAISVLKTIQEDAEPTDMILLKWVDASLVKSSTTIEDIRKHKGISDKNQLGFLMHKNGQRVFIGGRYNTVYNKYRYLNAIPTRNIKGITKLRVSKKIPFESVEQQ